MRSSTSALEPTENVRWAYPTCSAVFSLLRRGQIPPLLLLENRSMLVRLSCAGHTFAPWGCGNSQSATRVARLYQDHFLQSTLAKQALMATIASTELMVRYQKMIKPTNFC